MLRVETRKISEKYMNLFWHRVGFIEYYLSTRNPWQLLNMDSTLAHFVKTKKLIPPTSSPQPEYKFIF